MHLHVFGTLAVSLFFLTYAVAECHGGKSWRKKTIFFTSRFLQEKSPYSQRKVDFTAALRKIWKESKSKHKINNKSKGQVAHILGKSSKRL